MGHSFLLCQTQVLASLALSCTCAPQHMSCMDGALSQGQHAGHTNTLRASHACHSAHAQHMPAQAHRCAGHAGLHAWLISQPPKVITMQDIVRTHHPAATHASVVCCLIHHHAVGTLETTAFLAHQPSLRQHSTKPLVLGINCV